MISKTTFFYRELTLLLLALLCVSCAGNRSVKGKKTSDGDMLQFPFSAQPGSILHFRDNSRQEDFDFISKSSIISIRNHSNFTIAISLATNFSDSQKAIALQPGESKDIKEGLRFIYAVWPDSYSNSDRKIRGEMRVIFRTSVENRRPEKTIHLTVQRPPDVL